MKKRVILDIEKKKELACVFGVTLKCVFEALSFKTNSGIARTLRAAAIQRGGEIVGANGQIDMKFDTYWNESPHQMIQMFGDRVRIVVNIFPTYADIEVDGKSVKHFDSVTMRQMADIQPQAREIAQSLN